MSQNHKEIIIDLSDTAIESLDNLKKQSLNFFNSEKTEENLNFYDSENWDVEYDENVMLFETISFIQGALYYTENYIENKKFNCDTYLFDSDEILFSIDEYIFNIEQNVLNIWEKSFKKDESDTLYGEVSVDLVVYNFPYINNIRKIKVTPGDNTLENVLFSLTSCDKKIQVREDEFITAINKLILLYDKNYYIFNDFVKNGVVSISVYVRDFQ